MRGVKLVRTILLGIGALLLSACGALGTNSGGSPPPGQVRVDAPDADGAFYDAGSGWVQASNPTGFTFTASGAYKVALHCPGSGPGSGYFVYALTTAEVTHLYHPCPNSASTIMFTVNYDVSAISGATGAKLAHKASGFFPADAGSGATGSITVYGGISGPQDLVLLAVDGSNNVLAAKLWTANVQAGQTYNFPALTGSDAISQSGTFPNFSSIVPAGWSYGWSVHGVTPNNTVVLAGTDTPGTWQYYEYPFADRYLYGAYATNTVNETIFFFENRSASAGTPTVAFPQRVQFTFTRAQGQFTGLLNNTQLSLYTFKLSWGVDRTELVSKGYLGNATTYQLATMPNTFSAADSYKNSNGTVKTTYVNANKGLQAMLDSTMQNGTTWGFMLVDGIQIQQAEKEDTF